ncbi:hypothetical Protein YC6258_00886 [Gynuella sunshinyii YC6258]|uniref:Uncharacterized protein n=1 Tax=Gynuella sunshinyii YC6258 TaxID=1445510 RepID=A0A0C5VFI1_9GAMM|nr:hypothetical Protein YC6258_00886 [Gynuella sunshinyii YC6258]
MAKAPFKATCFIIFSNKKNSNIPFFVKSLKYVTKALSSYYFYWHS